MQRILFALIFCANPASAEADLFQTFTGSFGMPFSPTLSCKVNPHRVSFFDNNHRARFEWQSEIVGYDGRQVDFAEYTVVGIDQLGIILKLDGESRLTEAAAPVVWILRPVQGFDGYCWGRTDWPNARCIAPHTRCKDTVPSS
jgi:hypothetical protein